MIRKRRRYAAPGRDDKDFLAHLIKLDPSLRRAYSGCSRHRRGSWIGKGGTLLSLSYCLCETYVFHLSLVKTLDTIYRVSLFTYSE